jgi:hypothetical protein
LPVSSEPGDFFFFKRKQPPARLSLSGETTPGTPARRRSRNLTQILPEIARRRGRGRLWRGAQRRQSPARRAPPSRPPARRRAAAAAPHPHLPFVWT